MCYENFGVGRITYGKGRSAWPESISIQDKVYMKQWLIPKVTLFTGMEYMAYQSSDNDRLFLSASGQTISGQCNIPNYSTNKYNR